MIYTASQLSSMSDKELAKIYEELPVLTQEQKEVAWKRMDIGIYDENGNLIGDKYDGVLRGQSYPM